MIELFAQPYDSSAQGFYFQSLTEYQSKSAKLRNDAGQLVEEFEIQFIDGDDIDAELFMVLCIHQGNIGAFLGAIDDWNTYQKRKVIIGVREYGHDFVLGFSDPDGLDVDIFEMRDFRELAEYFVDEGLYGVIPESLLYYIDYEAIARDLRADYNETRIAGKNLIYRCP